MSLIYKIRRKSDGLFSTGGCNPRFTKIGKIWRNKGGLSSHLALVSHASDYDDCEVIVYELAEIQADEPRPVGEYLQEMRERKDKREKEQKARWEKWQRDRRYQEFLRLKNEFENNE